MIPTALPWEPWGEGLLGDMETEERPSGSQGGFWRGRYLQAVQEELHAVEVKEHLTVVGSLIRDVPQGAPGELHHLVTLKRGEGSAQVHLDGPPGSWHPVTGSPDTMWTPPQGQASPFSG